VLRGFKDPFMWLFADLLVQEGAGLGQSMHGGTSQFLESARQRGTERQLELMGASKPAEASREASRTVDMSKWLFAC
jgi:hypothetical protein